MKKNITKYPVIPREKKDSFFMRMQSFILDKGKRNFPFTGSVNPFIVSDEEFIDLLSNGVIKNLDDTNESGWGYLHFAAVRNNVKIIKELLKRGANVDLLNSDNQTPLYLAVLFESLDAVKELLAHNANTNYTDINGNHILFIAELRRNPKLNKILEIETKKTLFDIYENKLLKYTKTK